jgi:hypothetical protein
MNSHYEKHPDYLDWRLQGDDFQQMLHRRSKDFFDIPDRPVFILPEQYGDYRIKPGNWITGTHHMGAHGHLILTCSLIPAKEKFDHFSWLCPKNVKHIPDIEVFTFTSIRQDEYMKLNGRIPKGDDHKEWFGGFVAIDDCLIEINNTWQGLIRIWKIPEPAEVTKLRDGQLTLF